MYASPSILYTHLLHIRATFSTNLKHICAGTTSTKEVNTKYTGNKSFKVGVVDLEHVENNMSEKCGQRGSCLLIQGCLLIVYVYKTTQENKSIF